MSIFEENEKLKENLLIKTEAFDAKTVHYRDGFLLYKEPFLETIVRWEKDVEEDQIKKAIRLITIFIDKTIDRCYVSDVQYSVMYGHPELAWLIYKNGEDFFQKAVH